MNSRDDFFMRRALALARKEGNRVSPNPQVGAVVVAGDTIVGTGRHCGPGTCHAEVAALEQAGSRSKGAELFVTLEPCNHHGATPPCVEAILRAGIRRVVYAMADPNPNVNGGGGKCLSAAGVSVTAGVCRESAQELLRAWTTWVHYKVPYVTLKLAVSKDWKIAFEQNEPQWLSGPVARAQVQRLRRAVDAIMVGSGTVHSDNPRLTNRSGRGAQPLKVILASKGDLSDDASLFYGTAPLIVCTQDTSDEQAEALESYGAIVMRQPQHGLVDVAALLSELGKQDIVSVLCEGGAQLAETLVCLRLANEVLLYETPHTVGAGGVALSDLFHTRGQLPGYTLKRRQRVGKDVLFHYELC